jgi:transposase
VEDETMTAIGIDTHKDSLAACAIDALGAVVAELTVNNDPAGHDQLASWASRVAPGARLGFEGSSSFGAAAARTLEAAGLAVREVPPHLSRRERIRTHRAGKSDPGDALAIARVTARETDLPPIRRVDPTTELDLLLAARTDLVAEATRVRNRLHADLVVLVPGYGATAANLVYERHLVTVGRSLRRLTGVHAELARERLADLRRLNGRIGVLGSRIERLVAGHPLLRLPGVGVLTAAALIGEAGELTRFRSPDAFAMLAGVAPIPASSGQVQRMRLNRGGNRQLNRALHVVATVQARCHPPAKAYVARKLAEGKTQRDAVRCLKRQLVRTIFGLLVEGSQHAKAAA